MQSYSMSFVKNFSDSKFGDNVFTTGSGDATGAPPCSFGCVFIMGSTVNVVTRGIFGNINAGATAGWGIWVADEWETLTNQIIYAQCGTTQLAVGSNGTGYTISSGQGRACFVVYTVDAVGGTANMYFQGQLIATNADPTPVADAADIILGDTYNANDGFTLGSVNMAFYHNAVLTEQEIQSMWNQLQCYGRITESVLNEPTLPQEPRWPAWTALPPAAAIDMDYLWQAHFLEGGSYNQTDPDGIPVGNLWTTRTWTSRGNTGKTAKILSRDATMTLPTIYMTHVPHVEWAGIIPHQTDPG